MRLIDAAQLLELVKTKVPFIYPLVLQIVNLAPSVDAEPVRHGRWVNGDCSECGYPVPTDDRIDYIAEEDCLYCHHCGAKMDGGSHDPAKCK